MIECLPSPCLSPSSWAQFPADPIFAIFQYCLEKGHTIRIAALACTNHHYHTIMTSYVKKIDLKQICPLLDILDAKRLGIEVDDEPPLNKLEVIKLYRIFVRCVAQGAGLAILTMFKDDTFRYLVDRAEQAGITLTVRWDQISKEFEHAPVQETCRMLITNNIVRKIVKDKLLTTRGQKYEKKEALVRQMGFDQIPTPQEQLALCVYQMIYNKKCPYGHPPTYGSTLRTHNISLLFGNGSLNSLHITSIVNDNKHCGAGGRKMLTRSKEQKPLAAYPKESTGSSTVQSHAFQQNFLTPSVRMPGTSDLAALKSKVAS